MRAFYNEIDPYCAAWLRNLIEAGEIPFGVVDERSIEDIAPTELAGFAQCHFFAGLGGWPLALRRAGWPDDRPAWTGSCPCQPFSSAGKGGGFADERHLWPAFDWLIGQCRPDIVFGEQVEGPAGRQWLDLVATDLEGHGYAFGTAVFPAAGLGAPQIRHRTYWVADSDNARLEGRLGMPERADQCAVGPRGLVGRLAGAEDFGRGGDRRELGASQGDRIREIPRQGDRRLEPGPSRESSRLARPDEGQRGRLTDGEGRECDGPAGRRQQGDGGASGDCEAGGVGCSDSERRDGLDALLRREEPGRLAGDLSEATGGGEAVRVADASMRRRQHESGCGPAEVQHQEVGDARSGAEFGGHGASAMRGVADADGGDACTEGLQRGREHGQRAQDGSAVRRGYTGPWPSPPRPVERPGPVNGFWRASDWLYCRDDKWRPVEPGSFPLVARIPGSVGPDGADQESEAKVQKAQGSRVGRLRAYGNAICVPQAVAFIEAVMDAWA